MDTLTIYWIGCGVTFVILILFYLFASQKLLDSMFGIESFYFDDDHILELNGTYILISFLWPILIILFIFALILCGLSEIMIKLRKYIQKRKELKE